MELVFMADVSAHFGLFQSLKRLGCLQHFEPNTSTGEISVKSTGGVRLTEIVDNLVVPGSEEGDIHLNIGCKNEFYYENLVFWLTKKNSKLMDHAAINRYRGLGNLINILFTSLIALLELEMDENIRRRLTIFVLSEEC